jgi:hypothetical protein
MLTKKELLDFLKDVPDNYIIYFFPEDLENFVDDEGVPVEIKSHLVYVDPDCKEDQCYPTFIANIQTVEIVPYKDLGFSKPKKKKSKNKDK